MCQIQLVSNCLHSIPVRDKVAACVAITLLVVGIISHCYYYQGLEIPLTAYCLGGSILIAVILKNSCLKPTSDKKIGEQPDKQPTSNEPPLQPGPAKSENTPGTVELKPIYEEPEFVPTTISTHKDEGRYSIHRPAVDKLNKQTKLAYQEGLNEPDSAKFKNCAIGHKYNNISLESFKNDQLNAVASEAKGKRNYMEDVTMISSFQLNGKEAILFGVFDGHKDYGNAGRYIKSTLAGKLTRSLEGKQISHTLIADALTCSFVELNKECVFGGTTATCALVIDDIVYIANTGDSRAFFVGAEETIQLSEDAKATNERFSRAVKKLNHPIVKDIIGLPGKSSINVARDIGMSDLPSRPKITWMRRQKGYLVLVSDGITSVGSTRQFGDLIRKQFQAKKSRSEVAENVIRTADDSGSYDNMSVVLIEF